MSDDERILLIGSREPDEPPERELHDEARMLLRRVRRTVASMLKHVEDQTGEVSLKELLQKTGELEQAMRVAIQIESRYEDWRARNDDTHVADTDIDFDSVRTEIGCRIARLRESCADRSVS